MEQSKVIVDVALILPQGITMTQWKDGSIHIQYRVDDVLKLRDALIELSKTLTQRALEQVQAERKAELERQQIPENKLEAYDRKVKELMAELTEPPPSV